MTNWREVTCEKCKYRVGEECRRFPPADNEYNSLGIYATVMTKVFNGMEAYKEACAEYAEEQVDIESSGTP